jgi:hypothetical protein
VQRASGHREVIRESPTARQQRGILLANERSTEDLAHETHFTIGHSS